MRLRLRPMNDWEVSNEEILAHYYETLSHFVWANVSRVTVSGAIVVKLSARYKDGKAGVSSGRWRSVADPPEHAACCGSKSQI